MQLEWSADLLKGQVGVLLAAIVWAGGSIYSRHVRVPRSTLYNAGIQTLAAAVFQFLLATVDGEWSRFGAELWNPTAIAAILYLVLVGSCVGFVIYTFLMQAASPALTATYAFVNPIVAVVLGALLLREAVTPYVLFGGALIVASVLLLWHERMRKTAGR